MSSEKEDPSQIMDGASTIVPDSKVSCYLYIIHMKIV